MSSLHPEYVRILSTINISNLRDSFNSIEAAFVDKVISSQYVMVDKLNEDIKILKEQQLDKLLELESKLSNLIDTNYNLLQLLNKESHVKQN